MKHLKKYNESVELKMYYFNPHNYDCAYSIMANSREDALNLLVDHLHREVFNAGDDQLSIEIERIYDIWASATSDSLPDKYSIDEFGYDDVLQTEIS